MSVPKTFYLRSFYTYDGFRCKLEQTEILIFFVQHNIVTVLFFLRCVEGGFENQQIDFQFWIAL